MKPKFHKRALDSLRDKILSLWPEALVFSEPGDDLLVRGQFPLDPLIRGLIDEHWTDWQFTDAKRLDVVRQMAKDLGITKVVMVDVTDRPHLELDDDIWFLYIPSSGFLRQSKFTLDRTREELDLFHSNDLIWRYKR